MLNQQFDNIDLQSNESGFWVTLDQNTSHADIVNLLEWLPPAYELAFYDQYYPSLSDPGAYVSIQRKDAVFMYFMGNHGWSASWQVQSKQMLAALIQINNGAKDPFQDQVYQIEIRKANRLPKW